MLAYNCSPSFNWKAKLSDKEIAEFQREIGKMGYKFQFVTLSRIPLIKPQQCSNLLMNIKIMVWLLTLNYNKLSLQAEV